jgi:transaldolase
MKFFVDTADISEIEELAKTGLIDGVTTNPSLIAKSGKQFLPLIRDICKIIDGPVSAEVAATDYETMRKEAEILRNISNKVTVKVPMTPAGLKVCKELSDDGTAVNVTLCFSPAQAILAAKAGAAFVSPFVGRLDDIGADGLQLIADIVDIYDNYKSFTTEVLVASVRSPAHIVESAKLGAHVMTGPASVIKQLYNHPLTDKGLAAFIEDWAKTGQSILKD